MNLAWKELKYYKFKYILIESLLILMFFMAVFLSGLANGLGRAVSSSIDNADASYFVLSDDAENLITLSSISTQVFNQVKKQSGNNAASLSIKRMYINKPDSNLKLNITYFAVYRNGFLLPTVIEGKNLSDDTSENTIVLDSSFKNRDIAIGDVIIDSASGIPLKVVGFTRDELYGHIPLGFISKNIFFHMNKQINPLYQAAYNAVAIRGNDTGAIHVKGYEVVDKATVIKNIPGYLSEQLSIRMILWVLVFLSSAILGIFFYVITIQKQKEFGILKAIGMEMNELSKIIFYQVLMLSLFGALISNALAFLLSTLLPDEMPFYLTIENAAKISGAFTLISLLCSMISLNKIAKVDPLITIGGGET